MQFKLFSIISLFVFSTSCYFQDKQIDIGSTNTTTSTTADIVKLHESLKEFACVNCHSNSGKSLENLKIKLDEMKKQNPKAD